MRNLKDDHQVGDNAPSVVNLTQNKNNRYVATDTGRESGPTVCEQQGTVLEVFALA